MKSRDAEARLVRRIYLDCADVPSNFDGRTDDLVANDLRIIDFAPAGAHRMLRGR